MGAATGSTLDHPVPRPFPPTEADTIRQGLADALRGGHRAHGVSIQSEVLMASGRLINIPPFHLLSYSSRSRLAFTQGLFIASQSPLKPWCVGVVYLAHGCLEVV